MIIRTFTLFHIFFTCFGFITKAQTWRSKLYPSTWSADALGNFYTDKLIQNFSYAGYHRGETSGAFDALKPDPWTAVAVATHDPDLDHEALVRALRSPAGYVGVLGARRRLPERLERLQAAGLTTTELERLKAPIGLAIGARSPTEVAVSVIAEIIRTRS